MAQWMMWLMGAGVLVVLEMFTGTFYLLMLAFGMVCGAIAAFLGADLPIQTIVAAVVGVSATAVLRKSRWGRIKSNHASRDPNINLDIGQVLKIEEWSDGHTGVQTARAAYRGALWDVQLEKGSMALPGNFVIKEIRGNRLIVANANAAAQPT